MVDPIRSKMRTLETFLSVLRNVSSLIVTSLGVMKASGRVKGYLLKDNHV